MPWRGLANTFLLAMALFFLIMASMAEGALVFYDDFSSADIHGWASRGWINISEESPTLDDVIEENGYIRGWGDYGARIYQNLTNLTYGRSFTVAVNSSLGTTVQTNYVMVTFFKEWPQTNYVIFQLDYSDDFGATGYPWWYEGGACGSNYDFGASWSRDTSNHNFVIDYIADNNTLILYRDGTTYFSFSPSCNMSGYAVNLLMRTTESKFANISISGLQYEVPSVPLSVNITSPLNNTISNMKLNASYTVNLLSNCSIYINGTANQSDDGVNGTSFFYISDMADDGEYYYYINCTNGTSEGLSAANRYSYQATAPFIEIGYPLADNSSVFVNGTMYIIGNVTNANITSVNETIYNTSLSVFYSRISGDISNSTFYDLTNLSIGTLAWLNGEYLYVVHAADEVNYINETVLFQINNTPAPVAGIFTSPIPNGSYYGNMSFAWTACSSPLPLAYELYIGNSTNVTTSLINTSGVSFIYDTTVEDDGNFTAYLRCTDTFGLYANYAFVPFEIFNNAIPSITASSNIANVTAYPQSMGFTAYCLAERAYPVTMTTITNAIGIISSSGTTNMSRADSVFLSLPVNTIRVRCEYNSSIYDEKDYIVYMSATLTPSGTGGVSIDLTTLILVAFFVAMFVISIVYELNIFAFIAGLGLFFVGLYSMPIFAFKLLFMTSGAMMIFVWALKGFSD